jgi:hypothetical protein
MPYYKQREPRKFNFKDEPPKGGSKMAIRTIILLLFLIALLIWFFPEFFRDTDDRSDVRNAESSSVGGAIACMRLR